MAKGYAVPIIDLGEHEAVGRVDDVTADHPGEAVARQHGALAGAAARHDVVCRASVEEDGGEEPALDIGQLRGVLRRIHPVIVHDVAHRLHDLPERGLDEAVLCRLAVFVDECNSHDEIIPFMIE